MKRSDPDVNDFITDRIRDRSYQWSRESLLYALANSARQGILADVLEDICEDHGDTFENIKYYIDKHGF